MAYSTACVSGELCWMETVDGSPDSAFHQQRCTVSKDGYGMNNSPLLEIRWEGTSWRRRDMSWQEDALG